MSSTNASDKHREVAKFDRVPLPVEAARVGVTGWQLTRTSLRILTKLPTMGTIPDKVIRRSRRPFADLGPTYVKFGRSSRRVPAFGEQLSPQFRSLLDAVPPADSREVHALFKQELGADPADLFATFRRDAARVGLHRSGVLRHAAQRRGGRRQINARASGAGSPPTCRSSRLAQVVELAESAAGRGSGTWSPLIYADNLAEDWTSGSRPVDPMEACVRTARAAPLGYCNIHGSRSVRWDFHQRGRR